ncbi:hypothetical protein K4L44_07730 [Halosquirtibacter laminarini]|uniref:Uncharacterized protein n=1 Tax=Halosquirtibacter laminarini TaxID=3374600 RepID=A0AC61NJ20_9BACT|nr:hypothetical protein K4L44_07730 [Prolixibacteraceae bacterium]
MKSSFLIVFILFVFAIPLKAQKQENFWYKGSEYIQYNDDSLEIVCYYNLMEGSYKSYIYFHFNIYNKTNKPILYTEDATTVYIKKHKGDNWKKINLTTKGDYYRYYYSPESHYKLTNDDFTMNHTPITIYVKKQVNDSTTKTVPETQLITQQSPSPYECLQKTHMSTRYLSKTTLIKNRHASGLIKTDKYYKIPYQIMVVIDMDGMTKIKLKFSPIEEDLK